MLLAISFHCNHSLVCKLKALRSLISTMSGFGSVGDLFDAHLKFALIILSKLEPLGFLELRQMPVLPYDITVLVSMTLSGAH